MENRTLGEYWTNVNWAVETSDDCEQKVDHLRSLLLSLEALKHNGLDDATHSAVSGRLWKEYDCLVDHMEPSSGLDNYSEPISILTKDRPNDSENWKLDSCLENLKPVAETKNDSKLIHICLSKKKERLLQLKNKIEMGNQPRSRDQAPALTNNNPTKRKHEPLEQNSSSVFQPTPPSSTKRMHPTPDRKSPIYDRIEDSSTTAVVPTHQEDQSGPALTSVNENPTNRNPFKTARDQLIIDQRKNRKKSQSSGYGTSKRSLGTRRTANSKFVPPVNQDNNEREQYGGGSKEKQTELNPKYAECEWMKNIDPKMVELIENEIMEMGTEVTWDDIAGLEFAKNTIQEIVIWPMLRPDIFTGLRGPPKGLLLFGPPGTGKTLIGKCIASQSNATFFSISASSLTSKWIGEGEKMVRALFSVARCHQPSVVFIDEIDSLLTQRSDGEHESSRRIKTEFLVQLDGATCNHDDRLLVVGATNRPQELDEAARRRLVKRLYIALPEGTARIQIVHSLLKKQAHSLTEQDLQLIQDKTNGFSGADMANLCREAALGPIRSIADIRSIRASQVREVNIDDFVSALSRVRPSVSGKDLQVYMEWNQSYGCCAVT